jgi:hypothetical protein
MTQDTDDVSVGQVERDPGDQLWAVLYRDDQVIGRERVRTLRQGKRRVTDMVLAAADTTPVPLLPVQGGHDLVLRVRETPARAPAPRRRTPLWTAPGGVNRTPGTAAPTSGPDATIAAECPAPPDHGTPSPSTGCHGVRRSRARYDMPHPPNGGSRGAGLPFS